MINWYARGGKRLLDLGIVGVGLFLFALPMLWITWRLWREIGRPVFFRQVRVGRGGSLFTILKFRTMGPEGRVQPYCRRLRERALDELPQLFNILRGEMSFVGPRPLVPEELLELERIPRGIERFSVRPGLTGLAQLRSAKVPSLPERSKGDLEYIDCCSLYLDIRLLLGSVGVTIRGDWEA